jgi:hypothetical protein
MKFNVPQFIEHEAKIIGPLTFRQSVYIGSAGVIAFILYYSVPFSVFLPIIMVLGLSSFALAFLKINGKPLPEIIVSFFNFFFSSKIFLWQKEQTKTQKKIGTEIFKKSPSSLKEELSKESQLKKIGIKINTK